MTVNQRFAALGIAVATAVCTTPEYKLITDSARTPLVTPSHADSTIYGQPVSHDKVRT